MTVKTYDPKEISVIIGTRPISGYDAGSFVKVRRNADAFTLKVGADGKGVRSKSNDRSGEVEITLLQSSDDNEFLSNLAIADELSNGGIVPALIKDNLGSSLYAAEQIWVKKHADVDNAVEAGPRTWILQTDDLAMFTGKSNNS